MIYVIPLEFDLILFDVFLLDTEKLKVAIEFLQLIIEIFLFGFALISKGWIYCWLYFHHIWKIFKYASSYNNHIFSNQG